MTAKMGYFCKKPHFTMKNFKFWESEGWIKVRKGIPLRQNWSNNLFGVCGSSGDNGGDNAHWSRQ